MVAVSILGRSSIVLCVWSKVVWSVSTRVTSATSRAKATWGDFPQEWTHSWHACADDEHVVLEHGPVNRCCVFVCQGMYQLMHLHFNCHECNLQVGFRVIEYTIRDRSLRTLTTVMLGTDISSISQLRSGHGLTQIQH